MSLDNTIHAGSAQAPDISVPRSLSSPSASQGLRGVRLGVYRPWVAHADAEIRACMAAVLDTARDLGAQVKLPAAWLRVTLVPQDCGQGRTLCRADQLDPIC